jgi:hypothetical protein
MHSGAGRGNILLSGDRKLNGKEEGTHFAAL